MQTVMKSRCCVFKISHFYFLNRTLEVSAQLLPQFNGCIHNSVSDMLMNRCIVNSFSCRFLLIKPSIIFDLE